MKKGKKYTKTDSLQNIQIRHRMQWRLQIK